MLKTKQNQIQQNIIITKHLKITVYCFLEKRQWVAVHLFRVPRKKIHYFETHL